MTGRVAGNPLALLAKLLRRRAAVRPGGIIRAADLALCFLLVACSQGASPPTQEVFTYPPYCSEITCRPIHYMSVRLVDGERMRFPVLGGPYVYNGRIHVLRGEAFRVQPTIDQNAIVEMQYVDDAGFPGLTFLVSLERKDGAAVMDFSNPFPMAALFRAAEIDSETLMQSGTQVCAVGPGDTVSIRWFSGIDGIILYQFGLVDPGVWPTGCS